MRIAWLVVLVGCGGTPAKPAPKPVAPTFVAPAPKPAPPAPITASSDPAKTMAASIDGIPITVAELDRNMGPLRKQLDVDKDPAIREYKLAHERVKAMNEIIDRRLMVRAAAKLKVEATEAEVDAALAEIKNQNVLTEAQLVEILKQTGYTLETYRRELRDQLVVARFLQVQKAPGEPNDATAKRLATQLRAAAKITIVLVEPPIPPQMSPANALNASALLTPDDLAKTFKRRVPAFENEQLEPASDSFDSLHFKATGLPETSDIAYRVWKLEPTALEARWLEIQSSLPNVKPLKGLADGAFTSTEGKLTGIGFIARKSQMMVLLTCGTDLCKTAPETLAVAKLLLGRLDRVKP